MGITQKPSPKYWQEWIQYERLIIVWPGGIYPWSARPPSAFEKPISVIHHVNRRKEKNHAVTSVNAGKVFDRIQSFGTPVHDRKSQQTSNGELPQPSKGLYGSPQRAVKINSKGPDVPPTRAPSGAHSQGVCAEFSPVQEGEKRKLPLFYRWHDCVHGKIEKSQ